MNARVSYSFQRFPYGACPARSRRNKPYIPTSVGRKELDEETGLYYYGARYYDPMISLWLSVDPLAGHPNQVDKTPYGYAWGNPVRLTDPDGRCPICPWLDAVVDVGFIVYDIGVLVHEKITTGKTSEKNWAALGADVASVAVPMSFGAGLAVRASFKINKIALKSLKVFEIGKRVENVGGFASKYALNDHFIKHKNEFIGKFRNAEEYLKGAQNFFKRESDDIIQYTRKNGDIIRYDTKNNIFGVITEDGTIKTMFKPKEGMEYFKTQIKEDLGEKTLKQFENAIEQ